LVFITCNIFAQKRAFISPGLKFGYSFGKNGGFIFGLEVSIVLHSEDSFIYGAVVSIEHIKNAFILHAGLETTTPWIIGIEVGPSLLLQNGRNKFGFGATTYLGVILMPFVNYTWFSKKHSFVQTGSFLKIPIQIDGRKFSLGG
jgi:hypothetical protein